MRPYHVLFGLLFAGVSVAQDEDTGRDESNSSSPGMAMIANPDAAVRERYGLEAIEDAFEVLSSPPANVCDDIVFLAPGNLFPAFVGTGPTPDVGLTGRFYLPAPDGSPDGAEYIVNRSGDLGHEVWSLSARSAENAGDTFVLAVSGDAVAGEVLFRGRAYTISGSTDGYVSFSTASETAELPCGRAAAKSVVDKKVADRKASGPSPSDPPTALAATVVGGNAEFTGTLDVLYVYGTTMPALYGNTANLKAVVGAAVTKVQTAFDINKIDYRVRLVGIYSLSWTYFSPRPDPTGGVASCNDRSTLRNVTGGGDDVVFDIRDATGADVVFGLVPADSESGGCSNAVPSPSASNAADAFVTVAFGSELQSTRHELGHVMGLDHDYGNDCGASFADYGCGYSFMTPKACTCLSGAAACGSCSLSGNSPGCVDVPQFTDIMSKVNLGLRQDFYSDPCVQFSDFAGGTTSTCDDSTGITPGGTRITNGEGEIADARRRVNETIGTVAGYRAPTSAFDGPEMVSPPAGATLTSNNTTFVWTNPGGATLYTIEVGYPGQSWASHTTVNNYYAVTLNSSAPVVKVRVSAFVQLPGGAYWDWVSREYRYNNANKIIPCNLEEPSIIPDPAFAGNGCQIPFSFDTRCSYSAGTFTCNLDSSTASTGATASMVSRFTGPERLYDLAAWGVAEDGVPFCCLYSDENDDVTEARLEGTSGPDVLSFRFNTFSLTDYNGLGLAGFMTGLGGNDDLFGSDSAVSSYTESIYGRQGADRLFGGRGNDFLNGGMAADVIDGECGEDTIIGGGFNDQVADNLIGGLGDDTICSQLGGDTMLPSPQPGLMFEDDVMYYSSFVTAVQPATVAYAPSVCGHPAANDPPPPSNLGPQPWGSCDSYSLTSPPGLCAGKVAQ